MNKNIKIVDARGMLCPKPLILTKKAVNNLENSKEINILIDNETAKDNVEKFLCDNKVSFITNQEEDLFVISVNAEGQKITSEPKDYCVPSFQLKNKNNDSYVVKIASDLMGVGDKELGNLLIQAFINTLPEMDALPEKIIFYNSGVKLTVKSSPIADTLKKMEAEGVEILICGTCLDYYNLKDQVETGIVSNMYSILDSLRTANKIVEP